VQIILLLVGGGGGGGGGAGYISCKVYAEDTPILTIDSIVICQTHAKDLRRRLLKMHPGGHGAINTSISPCNHRSVPQNKSVIAEEIYLSMHSLLLSEKTN
jgi:hypothetical protein